MKNEENPKLINCPACQNKISFNAQACPKCGEPITDSIRQKEIDRIKGTKVLWAIIAILGFFLLLWLSSISPKSDTHTPPSSGSNDSIERTRKELDRKEIGGKIDDLLPQLEEYCRQGNDKACKEYEELKSARP